MGTQSNKTLVLAAMVFAVAMTFIDQTIVAIASPKIASELKLTATESQWVINGYLLALSALFAFGGRLADIIGRRRAVTIGVIVFAIASALCGFTPKGSGAAAWLIGFRVVQGAAAALMFPAAVGIVIAHYPINERGKAMAIFFGISGGLTAIGPIAGGFLTQWTWRSIFWINVPVAVIALVLIYVSKPEDTKRPAKLDFAGAAMITASMALVVLGLQQSPVWGWSDPATWGTIVVGVLLMAAFIVYELRVDEPLLDLSIFKSRFFSLDTAVLGLMSIAFVPFFFFASEYAQIALGQSASNAGEYLLYWFIGFVVAAQIGGRMLDERGIRVPLLLGTALGAVGFYLLASKLTDLHFGDQQWYIIFAGVGLGLLVGPVSTDAVNRAPPDKYSEVTGITQTARNFGASLGLAVLGAVLTSRNEHNVSHALTGAGVPSSTAHSVADSLSSGSSGSQSGGHASAALEHAVRLAFAHSTKTVFLIMAGVLAFTFILCLRGVPWASADPAAVTHWTPDATASDAGS